MILSTDPKYPEPLSIKGNQWLINPDNMAGYFLGVNVALGGEGKDS